MKQSLTVTLFLFIVLVSSCKKDSPAGIDKTKLKESRTTDGSGNVASQHFGYDNQGRINSYEYAYNHHVDKSATVSYSSNMITITYKPQKGIYGTFHSIGTYTLNDDQLPLQRSQYDSLNTQDPVTGQITLQTDTARYEYDAMGLLIKITGIQYDSTRLNNSTIKYISEKTLYNFQFTNSANVPTRLSISYHSTFRQQEQTTEHVLTYSGGEKYSFDYIQQYPNNLDFSNAVLLGEFGIFNKRTFPVNKTYTHLPNKISFLEATGSSFNNEAFSYFPNLPVGSIENYIWEFNANGLVSSLTNSKRTEFIYND